MYYLLTSLFIIWINLDPSIQTELYQNIENDLKELNVSCSEYDSCNDRLGSDSLFSYACHCGINCAKLGTCCLDSMYVDVPQPKLKQACRSVHNGNSYYMVDRCPSRNDVLESLCRKEWHGENDVMMIVPVTSLITSITYKNYFCYSCHETSDEFMYWNVEITSDFDIPTSHFEDEEEDEEGEEVEKDDYNLSSLRYDDFEQYWMTFIQKGDSVFSIPVNLTIQVPQEIRSLGWDCELEIISKCSTNWTDEVVSEKCQAYTALKYVRTDTDTLKYRNAHCALCNFEDVENISCKTRILIAEKVPFSFTHLLDINRSDGDKVGKIQKCEENHLWDPYARRCRKITCALPGYTVKEGKCIQG